MTATKLEVSWEKENMAQYIWLEILLQMNKAKNNEWP